MPQLCIHESCKIRANYNFEGKKPLYCNSHKKEGMIDITHKSCIHPDCKTRPSYNFEGNKISLYCFEHKLDNMIDVKSKKCIYKNCKILPSYNYQNEKIPLYCFVHKLDEMVDIKNKKCSHINCIKRPCFNYDTETNGKYCFVHKLEGMIDIANIKKICKTYLCGTRSSKKYDDYCLRCYIYTFPDKPISKNYKTKEFEVIQYIKEKFSEYNWISDKIISGGCSRRRPDLLLELEEQIIIIEIDENQHSNYDCSCENKRIMELSQDVGHKSIIFIRFNPDEYYIQKKKIKSCWGLDSKGFSIIIKDIEWKERLDILSSNINYWITNNTDKTVEVIQLFYDIK